MNKLIILSGMSGVGKDTVAKILLKNNSNIKKIKTYTTRKPRIEADQKTDSAYHFVNKTKFEQLIKKDKFLEWAKVHRYYYGSPQAEVEKIWKEKNIPLLIIDVQGFKIIKKKMPNQTISIFLQFDPQTSLRERLLKRQPNITDAEIKSREESAKKEANYANFYDYKIVNLEGKPEFSAEKIKKIINRLNF